MLTPENIEQEIQAIKARNLRVEGEKAWEISLFRVLTITVITYLIGGLLLWMIDSASPWRNAFIAALGYFISMQSLPIIKKKWIARYLKSRRTN